MAASKITFAAPAILAIAVSMANCTSSNFGGSAGQKGSSLDQSASKGSGDGRDAADGEELGKTDSGADGVDGSNDLGGVDTDVPGADSSDSIGSGGSDSGDGSSSGGSDGDGDTGGRDSGDDGDDDNDDGDDDLDDGDDSKNSDDADDDDETIAKTKYGATVKRVLADDSFDMKIEVLVQGKVLNTANLSFDEDDEDETKVAAAVCRANKDTCLRLTFTNTDGNHSGHVETAGETPCVFVQESGTTATVDVDTNGGEGGGMHQGTCRPGEDEQLVISCPNSKSLKVQACGK